MHFVARISCRRGAAAHFSRDICPPITVGMLGLAYGNTECQVLSSRSSPHDAKTLSMIRDKSRGGRSLTTLRPRPFLMTAPLSSRNMLSAGVIRDGHQAIYARLAPQDVSFASRQHDASAPDAKAGIILQAPAGTRHWLPRQVARLPIKISPLDIIALLHASGFSTIRPAVSQQCRPNFWPSNAYRRRLLVNARRADAASHLPTHSAHEVSTAYTTRSRRVLFDTSPTPRFSHLDYAHGQSSPFGATLRLRA